MYTEQTVIDKIEILEDGQIQVRKAFRVLKDGVKISENYHRHIIGPDLPLTELNKEDDKVKAIANALWTQEVKDAYIAKKNASH